MVPLERIPLWRESEFGWWRLEVLLVSEEMDFWHGLEVPIAAIFWDWEEFEKVFSTDFMDMWRESFWVSWVLTVVALEKRERRGW